MSTRSLRRRISGLALAGVFALAPMAARALPLNPDGSAAAREKAGGFLAWVEEVFTRAWERTGMMIDPDGAPRPNGASDDTDTGMMIDPNG